MKTYTNICWFTTESFLAYPTPVNILFNISPSSFLAAGPQTNHTNPHKQVFIYQQEKSLNCTTKNTAQLLTQIPREIEKELL